MPIHDKRKRRLQDDPTQRTALGLPAAAAFRRGDPMSAASATIRTLLVGVAIGAASLSIAALADQPPTIHRIGVLAPPTFATSPYPAGLRDRLRELGYIEGKNLVIEWRLSAGRDEELHSLAVELARSKVDVIVAGTTQAAHAALEATTVPVVFVSGDPVASGLAASLARPGGNGTGVSIVLTELTAKRLEFLHQLAPRARRIVYLMNSSNPIGPPQLEAAKKAARTLGVQLVTLDARNEAELDAALRAIAKHSGDGFVATVDALFRANKSKVARAVRKARLPAMFPSREYHDDGVLMSYGANTKEVGRKMAVYVDKILRGAKPADLPVEEMSTYELIIDLRVARELGLEVPQALLARADEVIR
jgi:putative ABC transport system substrate-binding protein